MMVVTHPLALSRRRGRTRRGVATAWLILIAVVLIVSLYGVQMLSFRSLRRAELQNAVDAATHAATRSLVSESFLAMPYPSGSAPNTTALPMDRTAMVKAAHGSGHHFSRLNIASGRTLRLAENPDNQPGGELYVGTLLRPLSHNFLTDPRTGFDPYHPDLNAVRVVARRGRVAASATYFVDHDVIGFRLPPPAPPPAPPQKPAFPPQTIPMVPVAVLSTPFVGAANTLDSWQNHADPASWEYNVMARRGTDRFKIDANPADTATFGKPVSGADNIPEITVTLTEGGASADNGWPVYFDPNSKFNPDLLAEAQTGVAYAGLPAVNGQSQGQFLLNVNGSRSANANQTVVTSHGLPGGGAAQLAAFLVGDPKQQLPGILGQPRVWMLYSQVQKDGHGNPTGVVVVGFVVARVMSARASGSAITIVLQPSVLVTDTAVTNTALRDLGPRGLYDPYIAKVRLVE